LSSNYFGENLLLAQNFFDRVRLAREKVGLSRIELAKILGLTNPVQISRYETGKAFPPIAALSKLAEALEIDLHWLITGKPSPGAIHLTPFCLEYLSDLSKQIKDCHKELSELLVQQSKEEGQSPQLERVKKALEQVRIELEGLEAYSEGLRKRLNEVLEPMGESI
jgi:transcriptional regulator with XRE-family HTH domain